MVRAISKVGWNLATLSDFQVSSDAAGVLGYDDIFTGHWFAVICGQNYNYCSCIFMELSMVSYTPTLDIKLASIAQYLSSLVVCHLFSFMASSVQGKVNPVMNALSCFLVQWFR